MAKIKQRNEQTPTPVAHEVVAPGPDLQVPLVNGLATTETQADHDGASQSEDDPRPEWNEDLGVLFLGQEVVKELSEHARTQRPLLAALEEAGWPSPMLNPFKGKTAKQRLHDAVAGLNQDQQHPSRKIVFGKTSKGSRVTWKIEKRKASQ
jgi:hypothetical protein